MRILCLLIMVSTITASAQCDPSETSLSMNIYTDGWGYETYWELVPGENTCGDQTIAWGSNIENVGCAGGGQQDAGNTESSYPNNSVVVVDPICLITGQTYTLHFTDDWGDGGLTFELFQNGSLFAIHQGTGANSFWTFQAGVNPLGAHDSPCNAMEILSGVGNAIELNNSNCYAQINEIEPFLGHCHADGMWCYDEVQHSVWAKFTVPDDGAYEISTVNPGTNFNTQMAIWFAEDCSDQNTFVLLSANDDHWQSESASGCNANPPDCVNQNTSAYLNVLQTFPDCCSNGWDDSCQSLYDQLSTSCSNPNNCTLTLQGFDSYGDGWNGGQIVIEVNGLATNYTLADGSFEEWVLPIEEGDEISISFIAGGWPEEISIKLLNTFNEILFEGPMFDLGINFYSTIGACSSTPYTHPAASTCFVHCLPPGTTCYVQIDGYSNETGNLVLSVLPFTEEPYILTESADLQCPVSIGIPSDAYIVTHIEGWGLNHNASWNGPNDYSSSDFHITSLNPGSYFLTMTDACQNQVLTTAVIHGPSPFAIESTATPSCLGNSNGAIEVQIAGATAPYSIYWTFPDGSNHAMPALDGLSPGLYFLNIVDANACSIAAPITVEALESAQFSLGEDLMVCENFSIALNGPSNMNSYAWSSGNNESSEFASFADYPIGEHPIDLTVTNAVGCVYSDTLVLTVQSCAEITELQSNCIIYPNPADHNVVVEGEFDQILITDALGRVVWSNSESGQRKIIDVHYFESGWYVVHQIGFHSNRSNLLLIQH